jgi:5-methylcytosine-specific restriction endonuclease McrA
MNLGQKILKLREQGKSYKQIKDKLGCSKGTISYHCGKGQKLKNAQRNKKNRKVIVSKVYDFQYDRKIKDKSKDFQRKRGKRIITFNWQDVIEKFGWETHCYLTGRPINIKSPKDYHFDHINPVSKGGSNTLDNLGITCCAANKAKNDLSVSEFLTLCKEVLEHNGYKVKKTK